MQKETLFYENLGKALRKSIRGLNDTLRFFKNCEETLYKDYTGDHGLGGGRLNLTDEEIQEILYYIQFKKDELQALVKQVVYYLDFERKYFLTKLPPSYLDSLDEEISGSYLQRMAAIQEQEKKQGGEKNDTTRTSNNK